MQTVCSVGNLFNLKYSYQSKSNAANKKGCRAQRAERGASADGWASENNMQIYEEEWIVATADKESASIEVSHRSSDHQAYFIP